MNRKCGCCCKKTYPCVKEGNIDKTVILTGSEGFFGSHIKNVLENTGYTVIGISHKDYDLCNYQDAINAISIPKAQYLIHAAAKSGGIAYNKIHPAEIFYENTIMNLNVLKAATLNPYIKRSINIISSCTYPDGEVLYEDKMWDGLPNETIKFFGMQKRNLILYSQALSKTYPNKQWKNLVFNNLYGPGDSIDPVRTKVVMALIKKFVDAKEQNLPSVEIWGTGVAKRQLTYVEDAANWVKLAIEKDEYPDLINMIGTTPDISIKDLAETISRLVNYTGNIVYDTTKADGQLRKVLNNTLCEQYFGELPEINQIEGLKKTINWYLETQK